MRGASHVFERLACATGALVKRLHLEGWGA